MSASGGGDSGNVIRGDFGGNSPHEHPEVPEVPEVPVERRGMDPGVMHVGFESRKCPPGTVALHETFGLCEIEWSKGFIRMIKYWVGDPEEGVEKKTQVHVRELTTFRP